MKPAASRRPPRASAGPAGAVRVNAQLGRDDLHAAAVAAIAARPARERVAIACSGGADSVALLLALWADFPERRGRWLVLHFNHRLRGRAAAGDAAFVRALARRLGERCVVGAWERKVRGERGVSEAEARAARWTFFGEAMRQARVRVIALGQQLDDVAETLLMRLTRGSGPAGLAAPRPVQRMADGTWRVRPLLTQSAAQLRDLLRRAGVRWREDRTNADDDYFRNRVRHRVLPALQAAALQDVLAGFAAARARCEEDDAALEAWLDERMPVRAAGEPCALARLRSLPRALQRRALHRWLGGGKLPEGPSPAVVEQLLGAIAAKRDVCVTIGPRRIAAIRGERLELLEAGAPAADAAGWPPLRLDPGVVRVGPRGDRLALRLVRLTPGLRARIRAGAFAPDRTVYLDPGAAWNGHFLVRAWRPGDRYRPLGAPGRRKLQDLFVDRKIPRDRRAGLPVVTDADGVPVWVPGLPPAAAHAVQPGSKGVVQLTYKEAVPMVHRSKTPGNRQHA